MAERIIFHVDMNAFFAAVEQRFNPALRGKPIVVCGNPEKRSVVAACSYEAKAHGIKNGMSLVEARRLCPSVLPIGGNPEKYVDIARHLFAMLAEFTPEVEVFSIDEAFMDLTSAASMIEPETIARRIKRRILDAYGLTCSVGIGPNKLIAKIGSNLQKPDGLVRVHQNQVAVLMRELPVEDLCGVGNKLKARLNELGIVTCEDLGAASESLLMSKFGIVGRYLKRMGQGMDHSPVMPFGAQSLVKSMGHAYTLPRDTEDDDEIQGTLLRLAERVARRLRADGYLGRTVGLTIRYGDFVSVLHHNTITYPTDTGMRIFQVAMQLFKTYCEPLAQRVRLIGVGVSNLSRGERQLSFLEADRRLSRLDRCLDRVCDRFGEFALVRAKAITPLIPKSHGFLLKSAWQKQGLILG